MIRINLARKRKTEFKFAGLDLSNIFSILKPAKKGETGKPSFNLRKSPITKVVGACAVIYLISGILEDYRKEEVLKVEKQITGVEKSVSEVQAKLAQVSGYEKIKARLDEDESTVRNKFDVITKLLGVRSSPSRMLLQIAQAIPEEVWLTDLKLSNDILKISGETHEYNQVSDFLKTLTDSALFEDISLSGISQAQASAPPPAGAGVPGKVLEERVVQKFEINARRRKTI